VRDGEVNLDGLTDQVIHTIRLNPMTGVDTSSITVPPPTNRCNNPTQWQQLPATGYPAGYSVLCQPIAGGGGPGGGSPSPPGAAIVLLGGELQAPADNSPSAAATATWRPQPYYDPFCDNWHDFQTGGGGNRCEASLYVGRAVSGTDDDTGGLVIGNSLSTNPDPRGQLISNGSIVAGYAGANPRELDVEGGIWARAACGAFHIANPWVPQPNFAPTNVAVGGVVAGYNNSGGSKNCNEECSSALNTAQFCPAGTIDETSSSNTLISDPDYAHEPIDLANVMKVDNQGGGATPLNPATLCTNTGGVVVMPATALPSTELGKKVYSAVYDNAADLNNFMNDPACNDSLFWFRPGVYYFDFTDKDGATAWNSPHGCIPSTATCDVSQLIAGSAGTSADMWNPCTADWSVAPTVGADTNGNATCQQPAKIVTSNSDTPGSAAQWDGTSNVDQMDGDMNSVLIGPGNATDYMKQDWFQTPVPERAGTVITKLQIEVGYSLPSPVNWYKPDPHDPLGRPGAYITLSGFSQGNCYLHLDPDTVTNPPTNHDQMGPPDTYTGLRHAVSGGTSVQVFDLTNGCDTSQPGIEDPDSSFPKPADCAGALPFTPTNYPKCLALHPQWLDQMYMQLNATASAAVPGGSPTNATNMAQVSLDAMQINVAWKGRPAPQFPGGCRISDPGVQWIMGGTSHIAWGETSSSDFQAELCASKQSLFPKPVGWVATQFPDGTQANTQSVQDGGAVVNNKDWVNGNGSTMGIGIYGLSDDNAPRPRLASTDPTDTADVTFSGANAPTYLAAQSSSNPLWQNSTNSGTPTWADVQSTGDTSGGLPVQAQVAWPGSSNNTAQLAFQMPDLTTLGIPTRSEITNVQVQVKHREGDLKSGVFTPGGLLVGTTPDVANVQLHFQPFNSGAKGANSYQSSPWDSVSNSYVATSNSLPVCTYQPTGPLAAADPATKWCTFNWGDNQATYDDYATPNPPVPAMADPPWTWQRDLTDQMSTVEGWSGSWFRWTVTMHGNSSASCGGICQHVAYVDSIRIRITYRPFGQQLRPLRGCVTTRTAWLPSTIVGADLASPLGSKTTALSHDWLDSDWGWNSNSSGGNVPSMTSDAAFGNPSTSSDGNDGPNGSAANDCPLIDISNSPGRVKFHLQGSIYAPSAAISLSGNSNDAQWVTQNITARQLSAIRQKLGRGVPGVGDAPIPRQPRTINLVICDQTPAANAPCPVGHTRLSTEVVITDTPAVPGYTEQNVSWQRNPPT
jgi:hypothetical protein